MAVPLMFQGMERLFAILLLFGSGTAAGAGLFEIRDYDPPTYPEARSPFVIQLAEQFGDADTLVVGDSLVEQTDLSAACGRTFNGGIGGARIQDVQAALPDLLASTTPEKLVIAIGANHFAAGNEIDDFRLLYPELIDGLAGRELVLVGISNSAEANAVVAEMAEERNIPFVDPIEGPLKPDGLHHTVEGSRAYREAIASGCATTG